MSSTQINQLSDGTIVVRGALHLDTVSSLFRCIDFSQYAEHTAEIDLSQVVSVDSAGVALCLDWITQAADKDVNVIFRGMSKQMQRLVSMNQLDDLFTRRDAL